jgi:branched-chain amino acid transport system ATP-binding protein
MTAQVSTSSEEVLKIENLRAGYGDLMVIHGLSLSVNNGECVALLGPNGAGKSTVMKVIGGALPIVSGVVELKGSQGAKDRINDIGWAPEGRQLFGDFTVRDNLLLSARAAGQAQNFNDSLEQCIELFPMLGQRLKTKAGSLSGGQQQMVAIARALVRRPKILLLDEPSMGIAPIVLESITDVLAKLREQGMTILIAEQRVKWLTGLLDRACFIQHGEIIRMGNRESLVDHELMQNMYLGA